MSVRHPRNGPIHDLAKIQNDLSSKDFRIADSLVQGVRKGLGDRSTPECQAKLRELVASLSAEDYAWCETLPDRPKGVVNTDVYGKKEANILWFVKLAWNKERARIYSCHPAECDMELKSGKILRSRS